ncbi:MAG TPA: RNA polymerase sigma-70 factor [Mycobacteriales bacterium]|jgi:RNA polymerase sigma-70 factor (ECF subfamily)|nr:RNA polymerase sigma-70 factor [Mycobacteriales bacterium]
MTSNDVDEFMAQRPRLVGIAYRMLGSTADAEDVVSEAYLRWKDRRDGEVSSSASYLATIVVRLCIDELRSARVRRESYVGPWLPEPVLVDEASPESAAELSDSLSLAFLVVLEELAPVERAAFLLHDVFDYDYAEIARMLERGEPACRQLVSRARRRIGERRHRFDADERAGRELAERFLAACAGGDLDGLMGVLADDVVLWTDGGGVVKAARRPIHGASKVARFLVAIATGIPAGTEFRESTINGRPGYLFIEDGTVTSTLSFDIVDGLVVGIASVLNPDKLRGLT